MVCGLNVMVPVVLKVLEAPLKQKTDLEIGRSRAFRNSVEPHTMSWPQLVVATAGINHLCCN